MKSPYRSIIFYVALGIILLGYFFADRAPETQIMIAMCVAMLAVIAEFVRIIVLRKWSDLHMAIGLGVMVVALFIPRETRIILISLGVAVIIFDMLQRLKARKGIEG